MSSQRFSIIPAGAVTDRSLEPRDLQVLCLLGRHTDQAGWCRRSQVKMAREIACSRGTVQNALERLYAAGWVEKRRLDTEVEEAGKPPSRSYAYRVLLDRDDFAPDGAAGAPESDDSASYAETASEEGGCQPVGRGANQLAGGANACVGTGANTYVGTKNVPLERPPSTNERDARAGEVKDRKAKFLAAFEARWPTSASDDRQRVAYAAEALTAADEKACLAGIAPFLEQYRRDGRKHVPAGWRFIEQRRWELLEAQREAAPPVTLAHPPDSAEARAIVVLHDLVGRGSALKIWRKPDGSVSYHRAITPQLAAIGGAPEVASWVTLDRFQAAAWELLLGQFFDTGVMRQQLREGSRAPWAWPPRKDGTISPVGEPGGEQGA